MAANTAPVFEKTPIAQGQQFTSTDTTSKKTLVTAGADGARIDSIPVSSNDTAAVNLAFYINDPNNGNTDIYIGVVNIPIGSGYTSVVRVEALTTLAPYLSFIPLPAGGLLKCNCVATMTAGKTVDVEVQGGHY